MRILLGLAAAGLMTASLSAAHAENYCGFLDQAHARVRCGFTSIKDCKQALHHKKGAVCMPSPSFAKSLRLGARTG
ncbi:MAG TPA: hypothetical protein VE224_00205 [Pseudolabrys sp.]|nr:hypothetical protein [Pseudolabrys sp.]